MAGTGDDSLQDGGPVDRMTIRNRKSSSEEYSGLRAFFNGSYIPRDTTVLQYMCDAATVPPFGEHIEGKNLTLEYYDVKVDNANEFELEVHCDCKRQSPARLKYDATFWVTVPCETKEALANEADTTCYQSPLRLVCQAAQFLDEYILHVICSQGFPETDPSIKHCVKSSRTDSVTLDVEFIICRTRPEGRVNRIYVFPGHMISTDLVVQGDYRFSESYNAWNARAYLSLITRSFAEPAVGVGIVDKTPELWEVKCCQEWFGKNPKELLLAFFMGFHSRLGKDSLLNTLDASVMELFIQDMLKPRDISKWEVRRIIRQKVDEHAPATQ